MKAFSRKTLATLAVTTSLFSMSSTHATVLMKPNEVPAAAYDSAFLTQNYNNSITPPEKILGFEVGTRTATPAQITQAIKLWASESDRIKLVEYARSYEDRPLHYFGDFDRVEFVETR